MKKRFFVFVLLFALLVCIFPTVSATAEPAKAKRNAAATGIPQNDVLLEADEPSVPTGYQVTNAPLNPVKRDSNSAVATDLAFTLSADGTVLTITGTGAMPMYSSAASVPWNTYTNRSTVKHVTVSEGITSISQYAFQNMGALETITLPDTLTEIGYAAFNLCSSLQAITIPAAMTGIDSFAFYGCSSLNTYAVEDGNTAFCVENGVLYDIEKHYIFGFPANRTEPYTIPETVTVLYETSLANADKLTGLCLPKQIQIYSNALYYNTSLQFIEVNPESEQYTSIGGVLYSKDKKTLVQYPAGKPDKEYRVLDGTEVMEYGCMFHTSYLETITVPEGVTQMNSSTFTASSKLTSVVLPNSLTYLGPHAFEYCAQLESVTMPQTLEVFGYASFKDCSSLTSIQIPRGLPDIPYQTFQGCSSLTEVFLPDSVVHIVDSAFYSCTKLKSIRFPQKLQTIGATAFYSSALESVILPDGLQSIGSYAFSSCDNLKEILIPATVTSIGSSCFSWDDRLTSIHFLGDFPSCNSNITCFVPTGTELHYNSAASGWDTANLDSVTLVGCEMTVTSSATCTKDGKLAVKCEHCGKQYSISTPAFGHTFGKWELTASPTAAAPGMWTRFCLTCGESQTWEIPPLMTAEQIPMESHNLNRQDYTVWSRTVKSYLCANEDGSFTRIESDDKVVVAERYDKDGHFLSRTDLPMALPIFGGFYEGTDSFFLAFGQTNPNESDDTEVVRVVQYTKDWLYKGSASLYGANTYFPFDAGSLRMVQYGDMLYVDTCHEMYMSNDGLNHQSNMLFAVHIPDMEVTSGRYDVSNITSGYVSHSFNQFIALDGNRLVTVDHGDAYPRAIVLCRYDAPADNFDFDTSVSSLQLLPITGDIGRNATGASVGGLAVTDSTYMVAGNSIVQDGTMGFGGQRNIFLAVVAKENFSNQIPAVIWLTDYAADAEVAVSTPHLISINENKLLVMWSESNGVKYVFVDANGEKLTKVYSANAQLSDCVPIVCGNRVVWYVTASSQPVFCFMDLDKPETITVEHSHRYSIYLETEPTCDASGEILIICDLCSEQHFVTIPAINEADYDMGSTACGGYGYIYYIWKDTTYGTIEIDSHLYGFLPHDYIDVVTKPTCTDPGYTTHTCSFCGNVMVDSHTEPLGHTWDNGVITKEPTETVEGEKLFTCTVCRTTKTEPIPAFNHEHNYDVVVTAPTCTEQGYTTHTCLCGETYMDNIIAALGHAWDNGVVTKEPTETSEGEKLFTCTRCGATTTESIPKIDKPVPVENPFSDVKEKDYFFQPVLWAVGNGITNGTSPTTFGPNETCTRAQAVTFLWRANGSPKPTKTDNPFKDVKAGQYYYDAVLWAVETGITNGTSPTTFEPDAKCTRGQIVTFQWRSAGQQAPTKSDNPFKDVTARDYYYSPVLWAVENGITNGTSNTTFGPNDFCTRGHIVTFLYRQLAE